MESLVLYEGILNMLSQIKNDEKRLMDVFMYMKNEVLAEGRSGTKGRLPAGYESTVMQIADVVCNGAICYLNPETMEIERVQENGYLDAFDYNENNNESDEESSNFTKWGQFIKFKLSSPGELLNMMEEYVSELKDSILGSKLVGALEDYKPISSFLKVISECEYKEDWLRFRKKETVAYVNNILVNKL